MNNREHYGFIVISSITPVLGVIGAMVLLWNRVFGPADLTAFLLMFLIGGFGISTGYHRLLSHRAFKTPRAVRFALTAAGAMAAQGPPLTWAAHHRRHHRVADRPGDPHSPYDSDEPGLRGVLKGLWHAHIGWLFDSELSSDPIRYCPDLARDKDVRFITRHFLAFVVAGLALPTLIGLAWTGTWQGALTAFVWGGPVRIFFNNQTTYAVNSIGHFYGRRRFDTPDESRNVALLSILSFGDSWHNNHHAFPRVANHGFRWWEIDPSAVLIRTLEATGLARDVVRIDRTREQRRAEGLSRVGGGRRAALSPSKPLSERAGSEGDADVE
ncbi:fatty acid desaturase [Nocardia sp. CDC159]|uniref:Fatty acid desaturase n=1 Tax=Nocardia pulmonis TaxID=2951408 RepID=A0A9X2IW44_9NOCA|nr:MULTISPECIES: fatty acid desaturase [Nocardia]MCM6774562.1 fatty acid desaturase [Nocardia pulmonis]MCM6787373.1 fatty acid desaturase [Nocardia sp. CDC159]